mmetsp:Transcript_59082/g.105030  ORF Transcript_59082/g.105030 Transcript_59082/m.105030 type:complete len:159 (+) Transcript_59082:39-515(+)
MTSSKIDMEGEGWSFLNSESLGTDEYLRLKYADWSSADLNPLRWSKLLTPKRLAARLARPLENRPAQIRMKVSPRTFEWVDFPTPHEAITCLRERSQEPQRTCVVCLSEEPSVTIMPCRHNILCEQCADSLLRSLDAKCPLCIGKSSAVSTGLTRRKP